MTQQQLAKLLSVGVRTIGNWESGATVPKNRLGMLREVFGDDVLDGTSTDPIRDAPETVLLAELMRRAAARQAAVG
jgi:transcriptional regulator with XRE-family HTH domain